MSPLLDLTDQARTGKNIEFDLVFDTALDSTTRLVWLAIPTPDPLIGEDWKKFKKKYVDDLGSTAKKAKKSSLKACSSAAEGNIHVLNTQSSIRLSGFSVSVAKWRKLAELQASTRLMHLLAPLGVPVSCRAIKFLRRICSNSEARAPAGLVATDRSHPFQCPSECKDQPPTAT